MSADQFKYLFTPFRIKNVTIRNRIVSTAHSPLYANADGTAGERHAYYHAERARGGAGLIIFERISVHPTAGPAPGQVRGDEAGIPGLRRVVDRVHEHGAAIFCQLGHVGRQAHAGIREKWAPSAMPYLMFNYMSMTPKEMEIEDIHEVVEGWGRTAANLRESGFDGLDIHSGYGGYLLSAFMSPYSNKRQDEYGGSLENRMRIVYEVIDSIRRHVGDDYVVGIQLNCDDFTPGGLGVDDYREIAGRLEATGELDYLLIKAGTYWVQSMIVPDMQHPLGMWVPLAAEIREEVQLPLMTVGRINDPLMAEKVLAEGHADLVGMTRALICDPEMPIKAREGRLEDIRTCVGCNEGCIGLMFGAGSCVQNPAAGYEQKLGKGTLLPAAPRKKVVVVGGGPGGLKAAEVAARRGHQVLLYEKGSELGGQVNTAAKGAGRGELAGITRYLARQVEKLGVEVHLGTEVTPELIQEVKPQAVVVATGSVPRRVNFTGFPPFDPEHPEPRGIHQANVLTVWEALERAAPVGQRVLVADDGEGHFKGLSTAELFADQGKQVEFITPLPMIGFAVNGYSWAPLFRRILRKGIVFTTFTAIKEIDGSTVVVYNVYSHEERTLEDVDTVVLAYHGKADDGLYLALKGKVQELHRIGDCLAPRRIGDAIHEAERVARLL